MDKSDLIIKTIEDFKIGVHARLDKLNGNVAKNTTHRIEAQTTIKLLKWLIGAVGITNVIAVILFAVSKFS